MTFDPSSFINDKIKVMPPSGIRKFFDIVATMDGAISLGVGEPDFVTPWSVRYAGIYSLEKGRTHYTSNAGMMELREEICNYLKRRFNLDYNYKETLVTKTCTYEKYRYLCSECGDEYYRDVYYDKAHGDLEEVVEEPGCFSPGKKYISAAFRNVS